MVTCYLVFNVHLLIIQSWKNVNFLRIWGRFLRVLARLHNPYTHLVFQLIFSDEFLANRWISPEWHSSVFPALLIIQQPAAYLPVSFADSTQKTRLSISLWGSLKIIKVSISRLEIKFQSGMRFISLSGLEAPIIWPLRQRGSMKWHLEGQLWIPFYSHLYDPTGTWTRFIKSQLV